MFKKPLSATKTSAPLRSSDRRKLKQRVVESYGISSEDGDLLVPDGILSLKFSTRLDEHGVTYLSSEGDPLWFTIGKGSETLIPTIYTLWKKRDLLPTLSTPAAVIPILVGGADLMIPGVVHHTPNLQPDELVAILQYNYDREHPSLSPPLAVGQMAVPSTKLSSGRREKGKAVIVLHTWKDHLWDMGSKGDVPEPMPLKTKSGADVEPPLAETDAPNEESGAETATSLPASNLPTEELSGLTIEPTSGDPAPSSASAYTPQEITTLLNISLYQAIRSSIPTSAFPIPATLFYTNYILPARPAFPGTVLPHSGPPPPDASPCPSIFDLTIKSSTHKSLTAFLKTAEKSNLLTLKSPQKHSKQTDLLITHVNEKHPSVTEHAKHVTVKDIEEKVAKKEMRKEKAREAHEKEMAEVQVIELWKPHQSTVRVFEAMGASRTDVYSIAEVRTLVNSYISAKSLVNRAEGKIDLDNVLSTCLAKSLPRQKGKEPGPDLSSVKSMRREELTNAILDRMQQWHEVRAEGKDTVRKKGAIMPIQVVIKMRQGRKVCTLITGYESFLVVDAEEMAEDLRRVCAGSTSVSPVSGKPGMEVLVQGKQLKPVVDYLSGKGINKKWIEVNDTTGKK